MEKRFKRLAGVVIMAVLAILIYPVHAAVAACTIKVTSHSVSADGTVTAKPLDLVEGTAVCDVLTPLGARTDADKVRVLPAEEGSTPFVMNTRRYENRLWGYSWRFRLATSPAKVRVLALVAGVEEDKLELSFVPPGDPDAPSGTNTTITTTTAAKKANEPVRLFADVAAVFMPQIPNTANTGFGVSGTVGGCPGRLFCLGASGAYLRADVPIAPYLRPTESSAPADFSVWQIKPTLRPFYGPLSVEFWAGFGLGTKSWDQTFVRETRGQATFVTANTDVFAVIGFGGSLAFCAGHFRFGARAEVLIPLADGPWAVGGYNNNNDPLPMLSVFGGGCMKGGAP